MSKNRRDILVVFMLFLMVVSSLMMRGVKAQNKGTPIGTTGVPAPMLYDSGDPITLSYPCDASHMGIPFYNMTSGAARPIWICNGTSWIQASPAITATSVSIGGSLILLGGNVTGAATATGALVGQNCIATPSDGSFLQVGIVIDCVILTNGTATVRLSAIIAGTPAAKTYNVRIFQ